MPRSGGFGYCTQTINSSSTFSPSTATPSPAPSYVEDPVALDSHQTCGIPAVPAWASIVLVVFVFLLLLPELLIILGRASVYAKYGDNAAGASIGESADTEFIEDRKKVLEAKVPDFDPEPKKKKKSG